MLDIHVRGYYMSIALVGSVLVRHSTCAFVRCVSVSACSFNSFFTGRLSEISRTQSNSSQLTETHIHVCNKSTI